MPNLKYNCSLLVYFYVSSKRFIDLLPFLGGVLCHVACRILVPQPGVPVPPALEAWSLKHWATREVPTAFIYIYDPIFAYDVGLAFMIKKKFFFFKHLGIPTVFVEKLAFLELLVYLW